MRSPEPHPKKPTVTRIDSERISRRRGPVPTADRAGRGRRPHPTASRHLAVEALAAEHRAEEHDVRTLRPDQTDEASIAGARDTIVAESTGLFLIARAMGGIVAGGRSIIHIGSNMGLIGLEPCRLLFRPGSGKGRLR